MTVATRKYSSVYLGQVCTRGRHPEAKYPSTNPQIQSRIQHFARAQMRGTIFKYVNYYGAAETAPGGTVTITASIEYPIGTLNRLTFSGANSATIANGGDVWSDPLQVDIPDGAMFREWIYGAWSGTDCIYNSSSQNVDLSKIGASVTDVTGTGVTTGMTGGRFTYGFVAAIGYTDKPSILILGDSRTGGVGSYTAYGTNDTGNVPRPIGGSYGYINLSGTGVSLKQFHTLSTTKLKSLAQYCTHVVLAGGINDLDGGDSADTLRTNAGLVITDYAGTTKPAFLCTVEPYTTSTDSWATAANQTIWSGTKDTQRQAYNAYIRSGNFPGMWGFFDLAAQVEDSANLGKWLTPGLTTDGLHGTLLGELMESRAVNPSYFGSKAHP